MTNPKVNLITGATGGLGSTLANFFAARGETVIIMGKSIKKLEALDDELSQYNADIHLYPMDFRGATEADYNQLANVIKERFQSLNRLFHCAAWRGENASTSSLTLETWMQCFNIMTHAPMLLTRECLPQLQTSTGQLHFFEDTTVDTLAYQSGYAAAKASQRGLSQQLRNELSKATHSIDVCIHLTPALQTHLRKQAFPAEDASLLTTPDDFVTKIATTFDLI